MLQIKINFTNDGRIICKAVTNLFQMVKKFHFANSPLISMYTSYISQSVVHLVYFNDCIYSGDITADIFKTITFSIKTLVYFISFITFHGPVEILLLTRSSSGVP